MTITGDMIKEKGLSLAKDIIKKAEDPQDSTIVALHKFSASEGWLQNIKERLGISRKFQHGESSSVSESTVLKGLDALKSIMSEYDPKDIFNADETGLQWKMSPSSTLAKAGDAAKGTKKIKARISIMFCCNATGSEKLKPLVIGKLLLLTALTLNSSFLLLKYCFFLAAP